ncbi:hypothetical protein M8818_002482 [Zalaria obscura]|uniref:Uncharacterized protein n=1 Tax=Zalaria obscura TaxID=2024903 RepID=A0ACC3SJ50_9PEZI
MFLPPTAGSETPDVRSLAYGPLTTFQKPTSGTPTGGWSSIIGIVCAIVGNVLISFALNTQRYAHIQLAREKKEAGEKHRQQENKKHTRGGYGTQEAQIAEVRAKKNATSRPDGEEYEVEEVEGSESQPLIPRLHSRSSSSTSGSTIRPEDGHAAPIQEKSYLRSPWWWLGIALMTVGECGNFLAYGFAPASIVSPLGVVALVSNCLIAPLMLHEQFRLRDALGVVIAVAGCVTVVLSASDSNPRLGPDKIWSLITHWTFETYLGITVSLIIILMYCSSRYGDRTILIDLGLVGLFGGYTALSTKGVASLLSNTVWRVVTFPITYLLVAVLITTAVLQIKYVNRALQRFDSTQVIPVQFVLFTLSVIIGSAVLYRDFERESAQNAGKFVGGCALTFLGVWFITSRRDKSPSNDEDEELDEENEDTIDLQDEEGVQPEIIERSSDAQRRSSARGQPRKELRSFPSTPSIVISEHSDSDSQQSDFDELASMTANPWAASAARANLTSIHAKSTSILPIESESSDRQKPPFHATTSAPTVPTASSNHNTLRPVRSRAGQSETSVGRPMTPARQGQTQTLDPSTASVNTRFGSMNRHSIQQS